ncbi:MAG: type II toxin-antitoxin system HicB family antitoxin [Chloroflexi bacterium]|nr:type II toxin-antitoxin system HicB family antitoxin [Chloroflexota bacterium]MBL7061416.1 type II toxin-antitoxin system HicB family antitoxin [Dehalococcoidia bacterium]
MKGDNHAAVVEFKFRVVVEPDDDNFFAYCPDLLGLSTCGHTRNEALENMKDAATAYLRSLIKHRDPIPVGVITDIKLPKGLGTKSRSQSGRGSREEELVVATALS